MKEGHRNGWRRKRLERTDRQGARTLRPPTLPCPPNAPRLQNFTMLSVSPQATHEHLRVPKRAIPALATRRDAWRRHDPEQRERQQRRDGSDALAAIDSFWRCLLTSIDPRGRLVPGRHLVHGWRPRPRWHGGFRRADDTLAWLQRRSRAVDRQLSLDR